MNSKFALIQWTEAWIVIIHVNWRGLILFHFDQVLVNLLGLSIQVLEQIGVIHVDFLTIWRHWWVLQAWAGNVFTVNITISLITIGLWNLRRAFSHTVVIKVSIVNHSTFFLIFVSVMHVGMWHMLLSASSRLATFSRRLSLSHEISHLLLLLKSFSEIAIMVRAWFCGTNLSSSFKLFTSVHIFSWIVAEFWFLVIQLSVLLLLHMAVVLIECLVILLWWLLSMLILLVLIVSWSTTSNPMMSRLLLCSGNFSLILCISSISWIVVNWVSLQCKVIAVSIALSGILTMATSFIVIRELRSCKVLLIWARRWIKMLECCWILIFVVVAWWIALAGVWLVISIVETWWHEIGISVVLWVRIVVLWRSTIRLEAARVLIQVAHVEVLSSSTISAEFSWFHHQDLFKLILKFTAIANVIWGDQTTALVLVEWPFVAHLVMLRVPRMVIGIVTVVLIWEGKPRGIVLAWGVAVGILALIFTFALNIARFSYSTWLLMIIVAVFRSLSVVDDLRWIGHSRAASLVIELVGKSCFVHVVRIRVSLTLIVLKVVLLLLDSLPCVRRDTSSSERCTWVFGSSWLLRRRHDVFFRIWASVGFLSFFIDYFCIVFLVKDLGLDSSSKRTAIRVTRSMDVTVHVLLLVPLWFVNALLFLV